MEFVCGFLFSMDLKRFPLILKRRGPKVVIGKWNGIGGKIDQMYAERRSDHKRIELPPDRLALYEYIPKEDSPINWVVVRESPHEAMTREFQEETGVYIGVDRWRCFHIEYFLEEKIYFMAAFGDEILQVKTITDEEVKLFDKFDFFFDLDSTQYPLVFNIKYILHMIESRLGAGVFQNFNPEGVNKYK